MRSRIFVILLSAIVSAMSVSGQAIEAWRAGLQLGTDIGGAVPYPLSSMGSDSKMNASPKLSPSVGATITADIAPRWNITFEATFKEVGIGAKAWVSGQKYTDRDDPETTLSFRGTVNVDMKFSMIEMPLLAGYRLNGKSTLLAGVYYSRIVNSEFGSTPVKGTLTNLSRPDALPAPVTPDDPYTQDFDNDLDNWDAGLILGYRREVTDGINVSARLSMGVKDIFKRNNNYLDYKMLHVRGTVAVSYDIFKSKR